MTLSQKHFLKGLSSWAILLAGGWLLASIGWAYISGITASINDLAELSSQNREIEARYLAAFEDGDLLQSADLSTGRSVLITGTTRQAANRLETIMQDIEKIAAYSDYRFNSTAYSTTSINADLSRLTQKLQLKGPVDGLVDFLISLGAIEATISGFSISLQPPAHNQAALEITLLAYIYQEAEGDR